MLSLDGPEHDRHRAPFVAPLRLGAVRATLAGAVREEAALLLDALEPRRGGRAAARLRRPAGGGGRHALARALARGRRRGARPLRRDRRRRQRPQRGPARRGPRRRRRSPRSARRCGSDATGDLAEHEYVSNAAVMLFGGIETTEGMIANALVHLLDARRRRRAARSRGRGVAAARAGRRGGRPLRDRGRRCWAARRSPPATSCGSRSPPPTATRRRSRTRTAFDPARANARRHLAFAGGPHVCVGMHLARLEAHTALALLLERLPRLRLDPARPPEIRGLVFRKPPELQGSPARWAPGEEPAAGTPRPDPRRPRDGSTSPRWAASRVLAAGAARRSAPSRGWRRGSRSRRRP